MSTESYAYVDTVNSNLICCICRMPFIEPTATTSCTHTFCYSCISQAIAITPQCPVDRSTLTIGNLHPAGTIVRNLVDELMVECPHKASGCAHQCQRQLLSSHLKYDCMYTPIRCSEAECEQFVMKKDFKRHGENCVHRVVRCEACGADVKFSAMESHQVVCPAEEITCGHCDEVLVRGSLSAHQTECTEFPISCTYFNNGCSWSGPRRDLRDEHLPTCPYEAIKGFFAINSARVSELEMENTALKRVVESMEQALRNIRRDVDTAKASLGPWFRPAGTPNALEPPRQERIQRRRVSNPLNAAMFGSPPGNPITFDDANLVPPVSAMEFLPPSSLPPFADQALLAAPGEPSPSFFQPDGSQLLRNYGQSSVPAINFNTSLEASLSSLRGSIVSLSTSLDSLERRQDIMLTTETLRMHEEVGSLRAIVHGMRMQVHTIMMDRNSQIMGRWGTTPGEPRDSQAFSSNHLPSSTMIQGADNTVHSSSSTSTSTYPQYPPPPISNISVMTTVRRGGMENKL